MFYGVPSHRIAHANVLLRNIVAVGIVSAPLIGAVLISRQDEDMSRIFRLSLLRARFPLKCRLALLCLYHFLNTAGALYL